MQKKLSLILILIAVHFFGAAQESSVDKKYAKSLLQQARVAMYEGRFTDAQRSYSKLIELYPENALYHKEYGVSYLESNDDKGRSVQLLQMAKLKTKGEVEPDLLYYLGKAYQDNHRYDEAIETYNEYLVRVENEKKLDELTSEVNARIKMCQHGKYQLEQTEVNPIANKDKYKELNRYFVNATDYVVLENLGPNINTPYAEYSPVVLDNENILVFTSRQFIEGVNIDYYIDGEYYENVFVARKRESKWEKAIEIDYSSFFNSAIKNTPSHNSVLSKSYTDNQMMVLLNGKVHRLLYDNNSQTWGAPQEIMFENLPKKTTIWSASLSANEDQIFVSATIKKQGFGGRDLYFANKIADGQYGELQNLGAAVNTEKNEDSPFLSNDGKTLYFASQGHSSIGGYDIFKSAVNNGEFATPASLGIPINTANDEIHYLPSSDELFGYYASNRNGGYGSFDVYRVYTGKVDLQLTQKSDAVALNTSSLKGKPMDEIAFLTRPPGKPAPELAAKIEEVKTEMQAQAKADSVAIAINELANEPQKEETPINGLNNEPTPAAVAIPENKVIKQPNETTTQQPSKATTPSIKPNTESVIKPTNTSTPQASTPVASSNAPVNVPAAITVNIPFGFNGSELTTAAKKQLDELNKFLAQNPNALVTITGHADTTGPETVNVLVSQQRAMMAFNYLIAQGAPVYRVNYDYKGEREPLATASKNADNRRVEFDFEQYKLFEYVQFSINSSTLSAEAKQKLDAVASFIKTNGKLVVDLRGFTDSSGNPEYNKVLSQKRAKAVEAYLKEKGADSTGFTTQFFGSEKPTIPNDSDANRSLNRRVEIRIQ